MKKLILVAVILQLVIIIISARPTTAPPRKYEFGDIIVFPRYCIGNIALYNHYAIYVGSETEEDVGQGKNNDIVHRSGTEDKRNCQFGQLENVRNGSPDKKDNYLDHIYKDLSKADMKDRILNFINNCPKYEVRSNNCEHFATSIRYGKAMSQQTGAIAHCLAKDRSPMDEVDQCKKSGQGSS